MSEPNSPDSMGGKPAGQMAGSNPPNTMADPPSGHIGSLGQPRISPVGFTAGAFTILAISILTISARVFLRLQRTKSLQIDDYFLIVALVFLIAATALLQHFRDLNYLILNIELQNVIPGPDFPRLGQTEASVLDASSVLLWSSIFCVKFSFLFFFRKLIQRVRRLKTCWWIVMGVVAPSAAVCIGFGFYECPYFGEDVLVHCPANLLIQREHVYLNVTIVLDIFTDALIITLPIVLLWNVKIDLAKKMTLLGIFGLSFVMIVIALIRVAMAPIGSGIIDTTWLFFWQIVEAGIALLMVSVSAFRGLFGQAVKNSSYSSDKQKPGAQKNSTGASESRHSTPARGLRALISSPRSPKTLSTFTPRRTQPDTPIPRNGVMQAMLSSEPKTHPSDIEMGKMSDKSTENNLEISYKQEFEVTALEDKSLPPSPGPRVQSSRERMQEMPMRDSASPTSTAHAWSDSPTTGTGRSNRWTLSKTALGGGVLGDKADSTRTSRNTSQVRGPESKARSTSRSRTKTPDQSSSHKHSRREGGDSFSTTDMTYTSNREPKEWV